MKRYGGQEAQKLSLPAQGKSCNEAARQSRRSIALAAGSAMTWQGGQEAQWLSLPAQDKSLTVEARWVGRSIALPAGSRQELQ